MIDNKFGTVYAVVCHCIDEDFIVQIYASLQLAMDNKKRMETEDKKFGDDINCSYTIESHPVICE